jgi:hypothetical protein
MRQRDPAARKTAGARPGRGVCGFLTVLAIYATFWAVLVAVAWAGLSPERVLDLELENAMAYLPVWARVLIFVWAGLMIAGTVAAWMGRLQAFVWVVLAIPVHVAVFTQLGSNPYYDGELGYLNIALELAAVYLLFRPIQASWPASP